MFNTSMYIAQYLKPFIQERLKQDLRDAELTHTELVTQPSIYVRQTASTDAEVTIAKHDLDVTVPRKEGDKLNVEDLTSKMITKMKLIREELNRASADGASSSTAVPVSRSSTGDSKTDGAQWLCPFSGLPMAEMMEAFKRHKASNEGKVYDLYPVPDVAVKHAAERTTEPSSLKEYPMGHKLPTPAERQQTKMALQSQWTAEQQAEEAAMRHRQLDAIFSLMKGQKDRFGDPEDETINEQMQLYM